MQENQSTQDSGIDQSIPAQPDNNPAQDKQQERPPLKRNGLKDEFKKKGEELDQQQKPAMSKEDTVKFYEENLPFMRLQDEFEELKYRFSEREVKTAELRTRSMEMQVREIEALGFLGQWKAQQDEAKKQYDAKEKMKEEWDAMTPEQQEEYKQKAKANLRIMNLQAKGHVTYDGENWDQVIAFVTGETPIDLPPAYDEQSNFLFSVPDGNGNAIHLKIGAGQTLTRTEAGEFIVS